LKKEASSVINNTFFASNFDNFLSHIKELGKMIKALKETQTLRAGCSKAEPKNYDAPQTPSRGRRTATNPTI